MTNWEEFEQLESKGQWLSALDMLDKEIASSEVSHEPFVRGIYMCHNAILEENLSPSMVKILEDKLQQYFSSSRIYFSNNHEYLFFIGKILYVSEWLFDLDDDMKPIADRLAFKMQIRASEMKPNNKLYEWAWRFSLGDYSVSSYLADFIFFYEPLTMGWLEKKGFPGKYIIQSLEYSLNDAK